MEVFLSTLNSFFHFRSILECPFMIIWRDIMPDENYLRAPSQVCDSI